MDDIEYQPIVEPFYRCHPPDWTVPVAVGALTLEQGSVREVLAPNRLAFEWTPVPGLVGAFDSRRFRLGPIKVSTEFATLESDFQVFESGAGGRFCSSDDVTILYGDSDGCMVMADVHVPNLPDLHGTAVGSGASVRFARQESSFNGWVITMDPILDSFNHVRAAKAGVANLLTHVVRVRRTDGASFNKMALSGFLDDLYLALSFAFGDYLGPTLTAGRNAEGLVVMELLRPTAGFGWRTRSGVAPRGTGIAELLTHLGRLFLPDQRVLSTTIWWYLEARSTLVEASVVLAQAALERIAYHHLVTVTGQLTERKFKQRSAADRIHLTMTSLGIPLDLLGVNTDVAVLVTRSRNQQVHPRLNGDLVDVWEARDGALEAVELLLLRIADYRGPYHPRNALSAKAEAMVPWAEAKS